MLCPKILLTSCPAFNRRRTYPTPSIFRLLIGSGFISKILYASEYAKHNRTKVAFKTIIVIGSGLSQTKTQYTKIDRLRDTMSALDLKLSKMTYSKTFLMISVRADK